MSPSRARDPCTLAAKAEVSAWVILFSTHLPESSTQETPTGSSSTLPGHAAGSSGTHPCSHGPGEHPQESTWGSCLCSSSTPMQDRHVHSGADIHCQPKGTQIFWDLGCKWAIQVFTLAAQPKRAGFTVGYNKERNRNTPLTCTRADSCKNSRPALKGWKTKGHCDRFFKEKHLLCIFISKANKQVFFHNSENSSKQMKTTSTEGSHLARKMSSNPGKLWNRKENSLIMGKVKQP